MHLLAPAAGIKIAFQDIANRPADYPTGGDKCIAIDNRRDDICAPALHGIAASPAPAFQPAVHPALDNDFHAPLGTTSKYHDLLTYFTAPRVELRVIRERAANAPDSKIAIRIIKKIRGRVIHAAKIELISDRSSDMACREKILWRDRRT